MAISPSITCRPVDQTTWSDVETLFESKGSPHYCWCMVWRQGTKGSKPDLQSFVEQGIPIGILAYEADQPIAWCSVAPRTSHRRLGGDDSKTDVWSITCFFIRRSHRGQGVKQFLIQEALMYAKDNGAKYVEAYPVPPDAPSYRFMGFIPSFEASGFEYVKMAGTRRHVMIRSV